MTTPTTEAGKALLERHHDSEALLSADPREEWVADAWGCYGGDSDLIAAIEREAREPLEAQVKRAYTILASVQPAAHRATKQSPNEIARHFNQVLEDAIKGWCESYRLARAAEEDGCEEGT